MNPPTMPAPHPRQQPQEPQEPHQPPRPQERHGPPAGHAPHPPALAIEGGDAPDPELSIVIVNWNSKDYLAACLASLHRHLGEMDYEIIVVDSGSFDGSADLLLGAPHGRFLQSPVNLGFAGANNLGASLATAPMLLFLNPDTEVTAGSIQTLMQSHRSRPGTGISGCRLLNSDGSLQRSSVMPFPSVWNQTVDADFLQRRFPQQPCCLSALTFEGCPETVAVDAISGACMLIARKSFLRLGGFSEQYFMYAEDLDLCRKAGNAGLRVDYVPRAEVVHHGGGSSRHHRSGFANVMMRESLHRLLRTHRGGLHAGGYRAGLFGMALLRLAMMTVWWPVARATGRGAALAGSMRKWAAIWRWAVGFERWAVASARLPAPSVTRRAS